MASLLFELVGPENFEISTPSMSPRYSSSELRTKIWWRRQGSNLRPAVCQTAALPAELRPQFVLYFDFANLFS